MYTWGSRPGLKLFRDAERDDDLVSARMYAVCYRHFFNPAVQFRITLTGSASRTIVAIRNRCPSAVTS
jgi:hypothetical protein